MIKDTNKDLVKYSETDFLFSFIKETDSFCIWKASSKDINVKEFSENVLKITGYSDKELLDLPGGFYSLILSDDLARINKLNKNNIIIRWMRIILLFTG